LNSPLHLGLARRLQSLDPRRIPGYRFDVILVGGGAAGGAAALAAAEAGAEVAVLTKRGPAESNTVWAQGGIAAVFDPEDSFEAHAADTLAVGCGLADPAVVDAVVRGGPAALERLIAWGARFDRDAEGRLDLSREGGHRHRRILHAGGDSTGREIQDVLARNLAANPRITTFANTFVVDLVQDVSGRAVGLVAARGEGDLVLFQAGGVVLATGGAGQIFRETTNPPVATGDGIALGLRAGAVARDLEFFQFHPTCLYIAGAARVLISEIVRGAGGVLRDRRGVRFMPDYHPDAELAPRDVVSRAVFDRMVATEDTSVYLDLSNVDGDPHVRFPGISEICGYFGIDIARDPVPVRPGAHYMIGGLRVDLDGRTNVEGLRAVGECASTGLHGANRMGSNSLLEGLVLGARLGESIAAEAAGVTVRSLRRSLPGPSPAPAPERIQMNIQDVIYSLKSLMWNQLGVRRSERLMQDALAKMRLWTRAVAELAPPHPRSWELANMLLVSRLVAQGALARAESRGVHYREDHPEPVDAFRAHTDVVPVLDDGHLVEARVEHVPVDPTAPRPLRATSVR
jgi:L-aspartate oxidase